MGADLLAVQVSPAEGQHCEQEDPRDGVGGIDKAHGHGARINNSHPQQAECAGTQQVDDHRKHRIAAASDGTGEDICDTEDEI